MFHKYASALMLSPRWTAPTRHVSHPEKGQHHHKGQSFLTVQSSACSELLTAREGDKPEENASYPILTKARPSGKAQGAGDQRSGRRLSIRLVPIVRKPKKSRKQKLEWSEWAERHGRHSREGSGERSGSCANEIRK